MTWLHTHVTSLPENYESHVVSQWTENLTQFPVPRLICLGHAPRRVNVGTRILRRLGWDDESRTRRLVDKTIKEVRPHVLHSFFGNCGWANAEAAARNHVPHVVTFHGVDLSYLPRSDSRWYQRYRRMSGLVDLVLCEGPHMARCVAELGVDARKIEIFRLGIDLGRLPFVPRLNVSGVRKRFLIAGSFREKKGFPYALEALAQVAKIHTDLEITVVGDSTGSPREEEEKRKINAITATCGLMSRTRFLGYLPYAEAIQQMYQHDVFVSPSVTASDGDTEGGAPVTIIEAAATGMPIASTTHCDIPFVLGPRNRYDLVPERDAEALAQSILRLLDRRDWYPLVKENRALIESELDLRSQTLKLAAIYRRLAGPVDSTPRKGAEFSAPKHLPSLSRSHEKSKAV